MFFEGVCVSSFFRFVNGKNNKKKLYRIEKQ